MGGPVVSSHHLAARPSPPALLPPPARPDPPPADPNAPAFPVLARIYSTDVANLIDPRYPSHGVRPLNFPDPTHLASDSYVTSGPAPDDSSSKHLSGLMRMMDKSATADSKNYDLNHQSYQLLDERKKNGRGRRVRRGGGRKISTRPLRMTMDPRELSSFPENSGLQRERGVQLNTSTTQLNTSTTTVHNWNDNDNRPRPRVLKKPQVSMSPNNAINIGQPHHVETKGRRLWKAGYVTCIGRR